MRLEGIRSHLKMLTPHLVVLDVNQASAGVKARTGQQMVIVSSACQIS